MYEETIDANNPIKEYTGVWIPRAVMECQNLSAVEKIMYGEIASFESCYASNAWFAKQLGISEWSVSTHLSKLIKLGFVKKVGFDGRTRFLKAVRDFDKFSTKQEHSEEPKRSFSCQSRLWENPKANMRKTQNIYNRLNKSKYNKVYKYTLLSDGADNCKAEANFENPNKQETLNVSDNIQLKDNTITFSGKEEKPQIEGQVIVEPVNSSLSATSTQEKPVKAFGDARVNEAMELWSSIIGYEQKKSASNRRAGYNIMRSKSKGRDWLIKMLHLLKEAQKDKYSGIHISNLAELQIFYEKLLAWGASRYAQKQEDEAQKQKDEDLDWILGGYK